VDWTTIETTREPSRLPEIRLQRANTPRCPFGEPSVGAALERAQVPREQPFDRVIPDRALLMR
jgi:hypothetical protein